VTPALARVGLVVRTELRRKWRAIRGNDRQRLALALAGLFGILPVAVVSGGAFFFGRAVETGDVGPERALQYAQYGAGAVLAGLAVVVALRVVQDGASPDHPDGLLTALPHLEATLGLVGTELAVVGGIAGGVGALVAVAFGAGTGSPLAGLAVLVAVLSLAVPGVLLGFAAGLVVHNAFARSRTLARFRTAVGIVVVLAYLGAVFSQSGTNAFAPVVVALAATPAGWFGHLAMAPVASVDALRAGGAVALAVAGSGLLAGANSRLAAALWYVEPARPAGRTVESSGMGGLPGLSRPVGRVMRKAWVRARRNPIRLVYVAYPVFVLYAPVAESVRAGRVPATLPALVALYCAWSTGAAFTLNPLGDEGPVLPVTLTTPVTGRSLVGALCLAALVVGLPVTVAATLATALLSPLSVPASAATALAGGVLCVAATGVAAGAGALFPRLEAVRITRSREAVVPSLFAFGVYSLVLSLVGAPATAAGVPGARDTLADLLGVGADRLLVGAVGVTAVLGAAAALVGFRYAARTFDAYRYG